MGRSTYHYEYFFRHTFLTGYPDWITGSHLDDMYTVFGDVYLAQYRQFFLRAPWRLQDYQINSVWEKYLANFAYTG
jgi:bile salt-stimulated lipase